MNIYESSSLRKPIKVPIENGLFWEFALKAYCMLYRIVDSSVKLTSWKMASHNSKYYVKSIRQQDAKNCKRHDLFFSRNVSWITRTLFCVAIQMRRNWTIARTCWHWWKLFVVWIDWCIHV